MAMEGIFAGAADQGSMDVWRGAMEGKKNQKTEEEEEGD
jgi:hypothetical protein